jgi:hypothetical protein
MKLRRWRALAVVPVMIWVGAGAAAGRPETLDGKPPAAAARAAGVLRPAGTTSPASPVANHAATVVGSAWTADNQPIAQANVRLRDVITGKVAATTVGNAAGEFAFEDVPPGSYMVELLNARGHVQAVGHVFTIAPGETVATFVRTSTKVPWFAGFFKNTVTAVTAAAASEGVAAIAPIARPVSANK